MTKEELINNIKDRIAYINSQLENPPLDYMFYNEFIKENNLKSIPGLLQIPYVDFIAAVIFPTFEFSSFNELLEDIISFRRIFEDLDSQEFTDMKGIFRLFLKTARLGILDMIFNDEDKEHALETLHSIVAPKNSTRKELDVIQRAMLTIDKLIINNGKQGWDVSKLIKYYRGKPDVMDNTVAIIDMFKEFKEAKDVDFSQPKYKEDYRVQKTFEVCTSIVECRKILCQEYKKTEDNLSNRLSIYKRFLNDVENAFKKDEITNYELIIRNIDDEELKQEFLKLVCLHNMKEYDEVERKNRKLNDNSLTNYLSVLKNNGISRNEVDLKKIVNNSCDDLDKMLKILNAIVGDKEKIVRIIETSDLKSVKYFQELKTRGVLTNGAFIKYPELFDSNSDSRKAFDESIKIIEDNEIDTTLFSKSVDVLIENDNLDTNVNILRYYGLLDILKTTKKFSFLKKNNLFEIIDKVIELGYEDLLLEDIGLLNENNWDRIYVLKAIGLQPTDKKELIKYLRDDKFFVSDTLLKRYIDNASESYGNLDVNYEVDIMGLVKNHETSERTLNFDGVIISKNRVARNLVDEVFDVNDLFKAILKDCILSMDEIDTIKSCLKNKVYKLDY